MNTATYFTFPIKFLWPANYEDKEKTITECIRYSIYLYMKSGECGSGTLETKLDIARKKLHFSGSTIHAITETGEFLSKTVNEDEIITSVKTSYLFEARDGKLKLDLLLLLAAIKSIIGRRNFAKAYKNLIIYRMYGYDASITRYKFNKLVSAAIARRMLTVISAGRGYFVSIRYTPGELAEAVKEKIIKYSAKQAEVAKAGHDIQALKRKLKCENKKKQRVAFHYN
jgi:hypothetical protein